MEVSNKINQLSKNIKRIENNSQQTKFNYLQIEGEKALINNIYNLCFEFKSNENCYLKLQLNIDITNDINTNCNLYINDVFAFKNTCSGRAINLDYVVKVKNGVINIRVEVFGVDGYFDIVKSFLYTFGNVEHLPCDCTLVCVNDSNKSMVLFRKKHNLLFYTYLGESLIKVFGFEDIKAVDCAMSKLCENFYLVAFIDVCNTLKVFKLSTDLVTYSQVVLDEDVTSVCAYYKNGVELYAVKGNNVYNYSIDENINFSKQIMPFKAKKVSCNPNISEYIVIVDHKNCNKLVAV